MSKHPLLALRARIFIAALCGALAISAAHAEKPRFTSFPGPAVTVTAKPGSKAWAAAPIAMSWDSLKLCQYDLTRVEKSEGIFHFVTDDIRVPGAFIVAAKAATGLKPGTAVMVSTYVTSAYGRVAAIESGKAKVAFSWAGKIQTQPFALTEVLPMTGALSFGQPVAYSEGSAWKAGRLVYSDKARSWVLGFMGKPTQVATSALRPVAAKMFKAGDKVWIEWVGGYKPGTVKAVLSGGAGYTVQYDGQSKAESKSWAEVTTPFK